MTRARSEDGGSRSRSRGEQAGRDGERGSTPTLRFLIPCLVAAVSILVTTGLLRRSEQEQFARETALSERFLRDRLFVVQSLLPVEEHDPHRLETHFQLLALDPKIEQLALVGPDGIVRLASRSHLVGLPSSQVPGYDAVAASRAVATRQVLLVEDPTGASPSGYIPVSMASTAVDAGAEAPPSVLYGRLNLWHALQQQRVDSVNRGARTILVVLSVGLLLVAVLDELVVRRLRHVLAAMRRIAAGEHGARSGLRGNDEIGNLGAAFDAMAARLEEQHVELARSEARYRDLVEGTEDLVVIADADGVVEFVNSASERLLGLEPARCLGRSVFSFVHPDDAVRVAEWAASSLASRATTTSCGFRVRHVDGSDRDIVLNVRIRRGAGRKSGVFEGVARDVTALLAAQAGNRESQARLHALFQGARDAVLIVDASTWKVIDANPRAEELFGRARPELIGASRKALLRAPSQGAGVPSLSAPNWIDGVYRCEALLPDGSVAPVEVSAAGIALPDGQRVVQAVFHDLRERRDLEARLLQAEKMSVVGQLAAGVAHDFNNQLTGILGFSELLEMSLPEGDLRDYASQIRRAGVRSADLVRHLLAFSRKGKFREEPVELRRILHEVVEVLRASLDRRIELRLELAPGDSVVRGDPSQLQTALLNLGLNARDAMPDGGELVFETRPEPDPEGSGRPGISVLVRDTGAGMDEATLARALEPFFTTKAPGVGTGLGLAAVEGAVSGHHGVFRLESEPGHGTCAHLWLPLDASETPGVETEATAPSAARRRASILVVDDEAAVRELLRALLTQAGFSVEACAGGRQAIEAYRASRRDLVVLDLIMPEMSGAETMSLLQGMDPSVRVLLLSGYAPEEQSRALLLAGAREFLSKPCSRDDLLGAVERILGAAA